VNASWKIHQKAVSILKYIWKHIKYLDTIFPFTCNFWTCICIARSILDGFTLDSMNTLCVKGNTISKTPQDVPRVNDFQYSLSVSQPELNKYCRNTSRSLGERNSVVEIRAEFRRVLPPVTRVLPNFYECLSYYRSKIICFIFSENLSSESTRKEMHRLIWSCRHSVCPIKAPDIVLKVIF